MSDFETTVAQQVARAWLLARALHDEGDWSFRTPYSKDFATRYIDEEGHRVLFGAVLCIDPEDAGETVLELLCDEEMISNRTVDLPAGQSIVEWEISLPQTAIV